MALVYHNITPPEYFLGVHKDLVKLCFRGRRELTAYIDRCELALGDSEYNRQELEALGFPRTGVLPVVPDFSHLDVPPDRDRWPRIRRRLDQRDVRRPGDPEQEVRGRHPRVPRLPHAAQSALAAAAGRLVQRLRALPRDAARRSIARLGTPDVHFLGHVSNEELTALYDVADLFLCASEHEGFCVPLIEASTSACPVLAYAATAVPATMDGGGVLYDTKDPFEVARLMAAVLDDRRLEDAVVASQDAALERLLRARTSPARCCASSTQLLARRPATGARRSPGTSGRSSTSSSGSRSCGSSGRRCSGRCPTSRDRLGLARAPITETHPTPPINPEPDPAPSPRHDHQPVGPGGASRRRDRRQRARRARHAARRGARLGPLRADDRRRPARRRAAVRRSGGARAATSRSSTSRCRRR